MITTALVNAFNDIDITFTQLVDTPTDIIIHFDLGRDGDSIYRAHELTYPITVTDFDTLTMAFPIADLPLVLDRLAV